MRLYEEGHFGSDDPAHYVDVPDPIRLLEHATDEELRSFLAECVDNGIMTADQASKVRNLVPEWYRKKIQSAKGGT